MSHFTTFAIFPSESKELEEDFKKLYKTNADAYINLFSKKLEKPLSKFDIDFKVKSYRVYMEQDEIEKMKEYYKENDLNAIAKKIKDWNGDEGGVDEKGLYYDTTQNPNGKFDYWSVYDIFPAEELLLNFDKLGLMPQAILLPDCSLIESDEWFYSVSDKNIENFNKWEKKVKSILAEYPVALIALIDCHI